MGVRRIGRSTRSFTGQVASAKCAAPAAYESGLERDLLLLLECDHRVRTYETQPLTVQTGIGRYTPDVLVEFHARGFPPLLCEVKYTDELRRRRHEYKQAFAAAAHFARERGMRFRLVTERMIRGAHLHNAQRLLQNGRYPAQPASERRILASVRRGWHSGVPTTVGVVLLDYEHARTAGEVPESECPRRALWRMLASGALGANMSAAISPRTQLLPPEAASALTPGLLPWLIDEAPAYGTTGSLMPRVYER